MLTLIELTQNHIDLVLKIPLFRDKSIQIKERIKNELEYSAFEGQENTIVAEQGERCNFLYVLAKGILEVNRIDKAGNNVKIENIIAPRAFATPHLFNGNHILPATFKSTTDIIVIKITRDSIFKLMSSEPDVLESFLRISGSCNKCTAGRIEILSQRGVRNRFVHYIFDRKIDSANALLEHNQTELAEYLSVTRPALSKEVNRMIRENLIEVSESNIKLLNVSELMKYL